MNYKATTLSLIALAAASSAAAQTPAPGASPPPQAQPSASAPADSKAGGQFITRAQAGQWRASKLVGIDIYGPDNAKLGDVDELLMDQNGTVVALVIGIGGFLGMGVKEVALPMKAVRWEMTPRTTSSGSSPGRDAKPSGSTTAAAPPAERDYPAYGVIQMTKEQLQNAPTFHYLSDKSSTAATERPAPSRP